MVTRIDIDCLVIILEFLQDSPISLFSCALVNRTWCKNALPILWRNPWHDSIIDANDPIRRRRLLISKYIATLPFASKCILVQNKISLPPPITNPIFEYATFIRYLNLDALKLSIKSWIYDSSSPKEFHSVVCPQITVVAKELLQYFLQKTPFVHSIEAKYGNDVLEILLDILNTMPESKARLADLRELICHGALKVIPTFFSEISRTSRGIQRLIIDPYQDTEHLATLIKAQKNLREITIGHSYTSPTDSASRDAVFIALSNSRSISLLKIKYMYFPLVHLANLGNLEELSLQGFGKREIMNEIWEPLLSIPMLKLKKLFISSLFTNANLEIFSKFIQNSPRLQELTIRSSRISDPENSKLLLTSISQACQNLVKFEGPIMDQNVKELSQLLYSCPNLSFLYLHPSTEYYFMQDQMDFDDLLKEITRIQPARLDLLKIARGWKFSGELIGRFLESRKQLGKQICLYWSQSISTNERLDEIVKKYYDEGVFIHYNRNKYEDVDSYINQAITKSTKS
ncbi:9541_t:CDS:1 [Scutellospora calospora]|uniref:9541_t:CDS:1 n=1 Tax=Scutellospora calospora TaxID=85575 RepID=A0ACA9L2D5_9GLOM|nr:9541_t:CDS:1 [Scutellospora calospora]